MNNLPKQIGITGGIGAGKSTVARVFSLLGIPVYHADDRAKWLMAHSPSLIEGIKTHFGQESFTADGNLNRAYLAEKVFSNIDSTNIMNSLVHPAVGDDFTIWASQQHSPYVLKEAALLFETGSYQELDSVIMVTAPESLRIFRVALRDPQRTAEQIKGIIEKQWPEEKKLPLADFVVDNGDKKMVIPQILRIHKKISNSLKER